jgi:hypothetical protein
VKKIIFLLLAIVYFKVDAQVIISQPYIFQKETQVLTTPVNPNDVVRLSDLGGGSTINGFTVTSIPTIGLVITTGSPQSVIYQLFNQSQPPTASLSGGVNLEVSASSSSGTLNWSYGRQSATATIASAVINPGSLNVFGSQPSQPGTISGTQSVTIPATGSITFTETVTTIDSKIATASTTYNRLPEFYYGRSASATPNQTIILAVAGGSNPLSASKAQTGLVITASGSNYPYFAYPSSEGAINNIFDVNGFNVTSAFNQTTVSVTNASGYVQNYFVYTLNAATSSNYAITTN